ncbi:hypothetical protein ABR775_14660 [Bacillus cereus]|uniref:hypothetical protein n=1 Tax=Bacillus cereus TaxID=1396 RepID=UPI00355624F1|nr:hypothetical protein [Bacillus cereus]
MEHKIQLGEKIGNVVEIVAKSCFDGDVEKAITTILKSAVEENIMLDTRGTQDLDRIKTRISSIVR